MIKVESTPSKSRQLPHAFGVLEGRVAATPGTAAILRRNRTGLDRQGFTGKLGQIAAIDNGDVAVGLGAELDLDGLRAGAGCLARSLGNVARISTSLHLVGLAGAVQAVAEGLILGGYKFDRYKSAPDRSEPLVVEMIDAPDKELVRATTLAECEVFARDLINIPAADKGPAVLAEIIANRLQDAGVEVEVWDADRCAAERLNGLLAVAAGSERPPKMLKLSYRARRPRAHLALVGKGIVFDSGGLSLKPAEAMETMKTDMSGAAAVAGALEGIARLRVPVSVDGYLPLTDNMPGGLATKPGDVITYRNGKTIEVLNTDAEGRLVLADGLVLAAETNPDLIIDVATLTGAIKIALGNKIGGLFGSSDETVALVRSAADFTGERLWPMPMFEDYRRLVDSDVADMKNTSGRYGGAIAAALILAEFTSGQRWAHIDIAGPARAEQAYWWFGKGGTGFGTRTLIRVAELMAEEA